MTIAAWLIAMVGPVIARILASLGVSLIVLTGMVATVGALKTQITTNAASWPSIAIQLCGLYGVWECLGIVFGTWTFVLTWRSTQGFISLAKV